MTARRRGAGPADEGQLMLLVLCYTVIAALLVAAVVDLSSAYLRRRALLAAADGAALAAANEPDLAAVYAGTGDALPLSPVGADAAVQRYAADASLAERFEGFEVVDVRTDGVEVSVTLGSVVRLPFLGLVPGGDYPVTATVTARSPFRP